jgi:fructokinase
VITVVGELLVDLIDDRPHPGGSPANVAVALARLGRPVRLLTQLGGDTYGRLLLAHLNDNGVELAPGSRLDAPRTSTARTSLSADGQASYEFDIAWHRFTPPPPDPVSCLHTGSLATALAPGAEDVATLVRAARPDTMISFDPNCRPSLIDNRDGARDQIEAMVSASDIVKASRDDLAWLYPDRPPEKVGQEWLARGARLVVVTLGGSGAWAGTARHATTVAAPATRVVDTVGAGDAFTAGLLFALGEAKLLAAARRTELAAIDEPTLTGVLAFASRVAAATCARRGADPPTLAELSG